MARRIAIALTVLASGRAMTLAYIGRAGGAEAGDPPDAWLMPLVGDAAIGLTAIAVAALLTLRRTPTVWILAVAWSAIGAFDAVAAYLVDVRSPWPEFVMLRTFGPAMFAAATVMHVAIIVLLSRSTTMRAFGLLGTPIESVRMGSVPPTGPAAM